MYTDFHLRTLKLWCSGSAKSQYSGTSLKLSLLTSKVATDAAARVCKELG